MALRPRRPSAVTARFDRALGSISQAPGRSLARIGAEGGPLPAIFEGVSRFADALLEDGIQERRAEALTSAGQEGQAEAVRAVLESTAPVLREGNTEADTAFNRALQASYLANLDLIVERQSDKIMQEAGSDPQAFARRFDEMSDGVLEQLPQSWRPAATMELFRRRQDRLGTVQTNFRRQVEGEANADLITSMADYRARGTAALATDRDDQAVEWQAKAFGAIEARSDLTPQQKAQAKLDMAAEFRRHAALGDFRSVFDGDAFEQAETFIDEFRASETITDPDEREAVAREMEGVLDARLRELDADRKKREGAFTAGLENYVDAVSAGAEVAPEMADRFTDEAIERTIADPEAAARLKAVRVDAERQAAALKMVRGTSPETQAEILRAAAAEAEKPAGTDTDLALAPQNQRQLATLQKAIRADHEAREKDAAQYVLATDQAAGTAWAEYAEAPGPETYSTYSRVRDEAFDEMGIPSVVRRPVSKAFAAHQVEQLQSTFAKNPEEAAAQFSALAQTFGRDWPAVLGQLSAEGLAAETAAIAYTSNAGAQQMLVSAGRAGGAKELKKQLDAETVKAVDGALQDGLGPLYTVLGPTNGAFVNTVSAGARSLAYHLTLSGTPAEAAARRALDLMVGQNFQIVDTGRIRGLVPRSAGDVDAPALMAGADRWLQQELEDVTLDPFQFGNALNMQGLTAGQAQATARAMVRNNAEWVISPDGRRLILAAPGIGMPVEVLDASGRPIEIPVDDVETLGLRALDERGTGVRIEPPDTGR